MKIRKTDGEETADDPGPVGGSSLIADSDAGH
jgi:hypothetical protein